MKFSNNLNCMYSFILNNDNRALNYYKKIIQSVYASVDNITPLFNIHSLERSNFPYSSEILLFDNVQSKYDASKILKSFYQDETFDNLIDDDLSWLRLKCDKFYSDLDDSIVHELSYKNWFTYVAEPFSDIFNICSVSPQTSIDGRVNLTFYMFSPQYVTTEFSCFTIPAALVSLLSFDIDNVIRARLDFSSCQSYLQNAFNEYIDNNIDGIVNGINQFILRNVYSSYALSNYNFNTTNDFQSIKQHFAEFIARNKLSLFTNIKEVLIPKCLSTAVVLDIIDHLYNTGEIYNVISTDKFYVSTNAEMSVFQRYMDNYSVVKMAQYIMIPYKYKSLTKFIHLLPVIIEAYVDNELYPRTEGIDASGSIIESSNIDSLMLDYTYLASVINDYIESISEYFVNKSNYHAITTLACKLCLHDVISRFLSSQEYADWQISYLESINKNVEYNPRNANYIYLQDFVKFYLSARFLYDIYITEDFGAGFCTQLLNTVVSALTGLDYRYNETILRNSYNMFCNIFLRERFRNFVDSFIFSSLIKAILLERLNYYLLKRK